MHRPTYKQMERVWAIHTRFIHQVDITAGEAGLASNDKFERHLHINSIGNWIPDLFISSPVPYIYTQPYVPSFTKSQYADQKPINAWYGWEVTDGRVVRAGISVTWNVMSWSGGHEFKPQSGWPCGVVLLAL